MKKVISYTIGWDTKAKEGYLTAVDEEQVSHAFYNSPKNRSTN
jgi:hypothetical protein